ncbi:hypothetical protein HMPREF1527_00249 [Atopobium sp. oral taxon 199 str. F0494]|nr:hypothetical protein HMPREF1527_00249 [Atopobium sp. oral taxon 199 str. F0494]
MKTPKKGISCDKSPKNVMSCEVFLSQLWHFFGIGGWNGAVLKNFA